MRIKTVENVFSALDSYPGLSMVGLTRVTGLSYRTIRRACKALASSETISRTRWGRGAQHSTYTNFKIESNVNLNEIANTARTNRTS